MSDPVQPWVDAPHVRQLAENLVFRPPAPAPAHDDGFGDDFVGFAGGSPSESSPQPPARAKSAAAEPAPRPSRPPAPQAAPPVPAAAPVEVAKSISPAASAPLPEPPAPGPGPARSRETVPRADLSSSLLARVIPLREWMREKYSASDVFLLDSEGRVIFDDSGRGKLHFLARSLALIGKNQAETRARDVRVRVGTDAVLEVVPVETYHGRLVIGAVLPSALDDAAVLELSEALATAASR